MSIVQIMMTIIIVTILITVILGVASYGAYWLRRGRRPVQPVEVDTEPRFFYRFVPAATEDVSIAPQHPGRSRETIEAEDEEPARREQPSELAMSTLYLGHATASL
ncbi:MAG: hypothetical protein JSU87_00705 [Gemmatimonadota bacterium]|nr:MAG: hypothetical protein JSU87_00705 [Gemmatimonadota bacterium]